MFVSLATFDRYSRRTLPGMPRYGTAAVLGCWSPVSSASTDDMVGLVDHRQRWAGQLGGGR